MKLDGILQGNQALLYMERYVDEGTRTCSPFAAKSEAAPEYQPRSGCPSFELITVFAPQSQVSIFQADPQRNLLEFYVPSEQVRFLIHPETWASSGIDNLDELHALPAAAPPPSPPPPPPPRPALTTKPPATPPPPSVTPHPPRRISRSNRRLRRKNIRNSVEATHDLAHVRFDKFAYLPDSIGFT